MKIAVAQLNTKIGDVSGNKEKLLKAVASARKAGAELLVTPELVLTGYPPRDLLDYSSLIDDNLSALNEIAKACGEMAAVVGYVERNHGPIGKALYNSAAIIQNGKVVSSYRKQLLPYYDVFEDERYFEPGKEDGIFKIGNVRVGITICEDVWNLNGFLRRPYSTEPVVNLKGKVDVFVNLSASPFQLGKPAQRLELFRRTASVLNTPVYFCNAVGGNDELLFDGNSFALDAKGRLIGCCASFEEGIEVWDSAATQHSTVHPWPDEEMEWLFDALTMGLRDYVLKSGMKKVILGLSGGIDSSVVAAIAVKALGAENVLGVALPTRFTSSPSTDDALELATRLKINCLVCPIEELFATTEKSFTGWLGRAPASITKENVQPRLRMMVLMGLANEEGRFLLNTSNKSEIASGFATLYGDSAGALAVIGDLTKAEVYGMAEFLNVPGEIIPNRIIARAPTAELKENQVDQDVLPPYDELDSMVRWHVEEQQPPQNWAPVSDKSRATFLRMHAQSEFKRRQLPPVLRVSPRAFGVGRRIPVVSQKI